ncbi:MAG TPA: AAA family ATPase [Vicinamibacteria bacterium]
MSVPVLTFFNNKGGVGKTSLVFHLAWMMSELGKRVVTVDLDPQANLTSAFLPEEDLEVLWDTDTRGPRNTTIFQCVRPLTEVGDILSPQTQRISPRLHLVPGDLALAGFEDALSREWPNALGRENLFRPFRLLTAFWQVAQMAAKQSQAELILADVGPNLGAINRSALIGSDAIVIPLAADLFSLQGLRNLGPTLENWRSDWRERLAKYSEPAFELPKGIMRPIGFVLMQHSERLSRPAKAFRKWADRIPSTYAEEILRLDGLEVASDSNESCLAQLKHYRSLVPMAQEVRKPIFQLTSADGAIGSHSYAVVEAKRQFEELANRILERIGPGMTAKA